MNIQEFIWPAGINTPTPRIDVWDMSAGVHTFGYWEDGTKAGVDCPPAVKIAFPIINGNYDGNPEVIQFYEWIGKCVKDVSLFTIENYRKEFKC